MKTAAAYALMAITAFVIAMVLGHFVAGMMHRIIDQILLIMNGH